MLEAQPILPLADAVAAHDTATGAATDTIWSAWPVSGRAGAAAWAWLNDLRVLHSELIHVTGELRALHGERANQQQRAPEPVVSAVTAAMIAHVQRRGPDRRIRPLAPDAHRALTAYLAERIALMDRCVAWAADLEPPRLRRSVRSIGRIAASVRRRATMLLIEIDRPPRA